MAFLTTIAKKVRVMTKEEFLDLLSGEVGLYKEELETEDSEWIVKGFIDVDRNIYSITNDTKVVSKIIEIILIPRLHRFAEENGLKLELPTKQNFYPDLTFRDNEGHLFAVDFKSSYYTGETVNGLTLGSYWGYFRERDLVKNMDYSYNSYSSHTVLGILYRKATQYEAEQKVYSIDELAEIHSVIENFIFFVQPKWKIASDKPGSGNTRNIGAINNIDKLVNGKGPFADLGEEVYDDYWMGYFNKADARMAGIGTPRYNNLKSYKDYLASQAKKLRKLKRKK